MKRDKAQISELKAARGCGLEAHHTLDYYIWYTDGNWHGFSGNANPDVNQPYVVCTAHTAETWKKYEEEKKKEEEEAAKETEPSEPGETNPPSDATPEP